MNFMTQSQSTFRKLCFAGYLAALLLDHTASAELSKEAAQKVIADKFAALRAAENKSGLPAETPAPIEKQIDGGKLTLKAQSLDLGQGMTMPYCVIVREAKESDEKRSLFIAMHGGGKYEAETGPHTSPVNNSEFRAQISLAVKVYKPDGVYFVPRMADDRRGRWWYKHNQVAFDKVIDQAVVRWNVDPDRIYLMGISEGGYGTDILAPFMADRLAGANAMAGGVGLGNPPANLRNVAFRTDVGEKDNGFDRCAMATAFHAELDRLHEIDKDGYVHSLNIQPGRGHGIDYSQGVQWIVKHTRNPWPAKVVWVNQLLDGVRRKRFYWVAMPDAPEKVDIRIDALANRETNTITIDVATLDAANTDGNRTHGKDNVAEAKRTALAKTKVDLLLNDALLDIDKPITVIANGKEVFKGSIERSAEVIAAALAERPDPSGCPTAKITITTP